MATEAARLFVAIDGRVTGLERALARAQSSSQRTAASIDRDVGRVERSYGRAKTAAAAATIAFGAIGLKKAADEIVGFDRAMRNVNSIAQASERDFGRLSDSVLSLAGRTAQAPVTLAEGLYDLVSSGFKADEALSILEKSAKAATAGLTDTATSTKAVAAVLNAYKRPASDAGKVSDALFRTVDRGVISFSTLAENIGDVLPFASALGVSLEEVGAATATMTKAGVSGPETMTRIKGAMVALIKPSEDLKKVYDQLGVASGEELIQKTGSLQGALQALAEATGGNKEQMAKLFPDIRGLGGALLLTGQNARGATEDLNGLRNSAGATDRALAQQSRSISFAWNKLKAEVSAAAIAVGAVAVPAIVSGLAQVGPAAGAVADAFREIGESGVAMSALGGIVGALAGRMVGLGVAFTVGKVIAFATAIRTAGGAVNFLTGAITRNPVGALAVVLGTVAGAILGFKSRTDEATISQRELAASVRDFHSALDQIANAHLDARQAALNERAAELELAAAYRERRDLVAQGITQGPVWEQLQLRIANAKVNLERATRAASNADRDWNDTISEKSAEAQDHIQTLQGLADAARRNRDETRREVEALRSLIARRQEAGASSFELRRELAALRDKEEQLRGETDKAEAAQRDLNRAQREFRTTSRNAADALDGVIDKYLDLTKLPPAQLRIAAVIAFSGGFPEFKPLEDLGRGGSGGTDLRGPVLDGASRYMNDQVRSGAAGGALGALLGGGGQGDGRFSGMNRIAGGFGLGVTSGFRRGDPGWHGKNRARDYGGSAGAMLTFARTVGTMFGPRLLELIHSPLGWGIKNGRRVPARWFGDDVYQDHFDHVHVAMQRGGRVPGSGSGDKVPALLEPGEVVINRKAAAAYGPGFLLGLNERVARFQSGGMVRAARSARKAGFRGSSLKIALAVAAAESANFTDMTGDENLGGSYGPWMIHHPSHPQYNIRRLQTDWDYAAKAAYEVSRGGRNWGPWTMFRNGGYRRYLDEARRAAISSGRAGGGGQTAPGGGGRGGGFLPDRPARPGAFPAGGAEPAAKAERLPPSALDFGNRDLALAQLTPGTADDLAALKNLEGIALGQLDAALKTADPRDDIDAANLLRGIQDQIRSLTESINTGEAERTRVLDQLGQELKRMNDFALSVVAVTGREAVRALADLISGEIVGRGVVPRAATAGHGTVARF